VGFGLSWPMEVQQFPIVIVGLVGTRNMPLEDMVAAFLYILRMCVGHGYTPLRSFSVLEL
jgi:hypothetical protein